MAYPRFQRARSFRQIIRTTNASAGDDYTVASATYVALDATNISITLEAQVGDCLEVGASLRWEHSINNEAFVDAYTIVAGAPVNLISGASTHGVQAWYGGASTTPQVNGCGGSVMYTVVSGDLSSGQVTIRPYARLATATPVRVIYCRTIMPFHFWVKNLGPADPE